MIFHKISEAVQYRILNHFGVFNPLVGIRRSFDNLYRKNNINICYNKYIPTSYVAGARNILIAIESPALIEHYGWIDAGMRFDAEISFQNYFGLERYMCPRTIYACNDNFVDMPPMLKINQKNALISMIYSDKQLVAGHRLRHEVAQQLGQHVDLFGTGTGRPLKQKRDSLLPYQFQVVIENGKYPEYVTEKFFDCVKMGTVPVYWGGEQAIQKMGFDLSGILFFDTLDDLQALLNQKVNGDFYRDRQAAIQNNFDRLLEIRREDDMLLALHTVKLSYHHSTQSYLGNNKALLNLLDQRR